MSNKQEKDWGLASELLSVKKYMRHRTHLPFSGSTNRQKNARDSIIYRQKGNDLYKKKDHNERIHEQIWKTYTQSIALAPNNSEELACGYGNRSALLFHLERFKDCVKDCGKALSITKSDVLKTKLLTRKAECLFLMSKPAAQDVATKASQLLEKLQLDDEAVKPYDTKLNNILENSGKLKGKEKNHNSQIRKQYINQLSNFPRSKEAPYASKSVAIKYNKEFGRHLVATADMKPGEIFAIEKNYYTYISTGGMYMYCSNCAKSAWSSIPCKHCIFDVYCSESCRSEAWEKYHKWECSVYPHLWDIDENNEGSLFIMRFTLMALSEVGGIENMKKLLIEMDKRKDPRTKGFTEGVFDVNSVRSVYCSLINNEPETSYSVLQYTEEFCIDTYLLAKHTTFFGQKMDLSVAEMFKNDDVLFFAALLLHSFRAINYNANHICYTRNEYRSLYVTTVRPFTSLINHNCDPNIELFMAKRNITVAYAIKPIKKGTQLAHSYSYMNFLTHPKKHRQECLSKVYKFTCKCLACTEDWSNICLPKIHTMKDLTPELQKTYYEILAGMSSFHKVKSTEDIIYSPKMMQDIVFLLESVAKKFTPHCDMYQGFLQSLDKMFWDVFGSFHTTIPETCFSN